MPGHVLDNTEIIKAITANELIIERLENGQYEKLPAPDVKGLHRSSQVQPASLDLTVGRIFVPPLEPWPDEELPIDPEFRTGLDLSPGGSVIVETREKITLSDSLCGFGFPPASMAKNSILMTNPGHVDPGYQGHLTFTIINMGRGDFRLRQNEKLATLLLVKFDSSVSHSFRAIVGAPNPKSTEMAKVLNKLSPDFAAFERRARTEAEEVIQEHTKILEGHVDSAKDNYRSAKAGYTALHFAIPALLALVGTLLGTYISTRGYVNKERLLGVESSIASQFHEIKSLIDKIDGNSIDVSNFDVLDERVETLEEDKKIDFLDTRLSSLEEALNSLSQPSETGDNAINTTDD